MGSRRHWCDQQVMFYDGIHSTRGHCMTNRLGFMSLQPFFCSQFKASAFHLQVQHRTSVKKKPPITYIWDVVWFNVPRQATDRRHSKVLERVLEERKWKWKLRTLQFPVTATIIILIILIIKIMMMMNIQSASFQNEPQAL